MISEQKGFLRHVQACTRHNLSRMARFIVGGCPVGWIRREACLLLGQAYGFRFDQDSLILSLANDDLAARTHAIARAADLLSDHYGVPLTGEIYPVVEAMGGQVLAYIDRAAIPWFGVLGVGVHVNGFVRKEDGLHLWIAQRAMDRRIDPGKLDNMIAGGMPHGYSAYENLLKEGQEEAGLNPAQLTSAQEVGTLYYKVEMMKGLRNDALIVFDLEMPPELVPHNTDGEVDHFELMPGAQVMALVETTDRFKFNCNLVLIDFFLRHGLLPPDYPELLQLREALKGIRGEA